MSRKKYGASTVTWSLPVRVLLTLPLLIPAWLVLRMIWAVTERGDEDPQQLLARSLVGFVGAAVLLLAPRYLRSVWTPNPDWARDQHSAAAAERRLHDSLRKVQAESRAHDAEASTRSRLRW